jgi:hypothetical protein
MQPFVFFAVNQTSASNGAYPQCMTPVGGQPTPHDMVVISTSAGYFSELENVYQLETLTTVRDPPR